MIKCILFDLDGTLLDTAPDMAFALNQQRNRHSLPSLPYSVIRPHVGHGSKAMLKLGFKVDETHPNYGELLDEFFSLYEKHLLQSTQLFPEMDKVLKHIEDQQLPWGIVTNKPTKFTKLLLKNLQLDSRAACVICGDTLTTRKPNPATILHACQLLRLPPMDCLYVGDAAIDVLASKSAGTQSLVALYGYIHQEEDPFSWQADGYIKKPQEIIEWLRSVAL